MSSIEYLRLDGKLSHLIFILLRPPSVMIKPATAKSPQRASIDSKSCCRSLVGSKLSVTPTLPKL